MIDIGMRLKSDEVIDFLERYDLSVEYHFDRLHERESDSYTVESEALSLALRFDAGQHCTTIFIRHPAEIEAYAAANSLTLIKGPSWLRCDGPTRCLHYEFDGGKLKMITIMSSHTAPRVRTS